MILRFATWNIGGGFVVSRDGGYDTEDLNYFIRELKNDRCDIVCLQELHVATDDSDLLSHETLVARRFEMENARIVFTSKSHLKDDQFLSLAILANHPLVDSQYVKLENPQLRAIVPNRGIWYSFDKGLLICHISIHNTVIRIVCAHAVPFHIFGRDFMEDAFSNIRIQMADAIIGNDQEPTIIGADMNYEDSEILLPTVFEKGYQTAFSGVPTIPSGIQQDHILCSRHWSVQDYQVVPTQADHHLCTAALYMKKETDKFQ